MSSTADVDTTDELYDDVDASPDSLHSPMDDDEDSVPRILIVCQVPDAVFEEEQAQVICAYLFIYLFSHRAIHLSEITNGGKY